MHFAHRLQYAISFKSLRAVHVDTRTDYANTLSSTGLVLHQVLMILGGCFGIVSVLIAVYLLYGHLRYYTRPKEQQQSVPP